MSKTTSRFSGVIGAATNDIEKIRQQIEDLKQQREIIINHRLPKPEALARLIEFVDSEASSFNAWSEFGNSAATPAAIPSDITGFEIARGDTAPLLCWLLGDTIKQRLTELINRSDYIEGLPSDKRDDAAAKLNRQILDLERAEESIILDAEEAGLTIPRREDLNPAVVLEVRE